MQNLFANFVVTAANTINPADVTVRDIKPTEAVSCKHVYVPQYSIKRHSSPYTAVGAPTKYLLTIKYKMVPVIEPRVCKLKSLERDTPVRSVTPTRNASTPTSTQEPRKVAHYSRAPQLDTAVTLLNECNYILNLTFKKASLPNSITFDLEKPIVPTVYTNRLTPNKHVRRSDCSIYVVFDSKYGIKQSYLRTIIDLVLLGNSVKFTALDLHKTWALPAPSADVIGSKRIQQAVYLALTYNTVSDPHFSKLSDWLKAKNLVSKTDIAKYRLIPKEDKVARHEYLIELLPLIYARINQASNTHYALVEYAVGSNIVDDVLLDIKQYAAELNQISSRNQINVKPVDAELEDVIISKLRAHDLTLPTHLNIDWHKQFSHQSNRVVQTPEPFSYSHKYFTTSKDVAVMAAYAQYMSKHGLLDPTMDQLNDEYNALIAAGDNSSERFLELSFILGQFHIDYQKVELGSNKQMAAVTAGLDNLESTTRRLRHRLLEANDEFLDYAESIGIDAMDMTSDEVYATNDSTLISLYEVVMDLNVAIYRASKSYGL